jgi:uncharacterized protein YdbL (DUF1318 family)
VVKTNQLDDIMKRSFAIVASVVALFLAASVTSSFAKSKEVTLTGEAACAKCVLKEKDAQTCQTVIEVKRAKKKPQKYYVVANDVSKAFHEDVCHAAKNVKAVGTVKTENGKRELTLTKIELVK